MFSNEQKEGFRKQLFVLKTKSEMDKPKRKISQEGQEKIRLAGYQQWLSRAHEKHGQSFDYGKSFQDFLTQKGPEVFIMCKQHRLEFSVKPSNHLRFQSGGCKFCDKEKSSDYFLKREKEKFQKFFENVLCDRLEVKSEFSGMTSEIDILCKFHQTIEKHKPTFLMNNNAFGCNQCAHESRGNRSRLIIDQIQIEFEGILPEHIKIMSVAYDERTKSSKIQAICEIHGEFETTKGYLKRSEHKCPDCGNESIGYAGNRLKALVQSESKGRPTYVGVMSVLVFGIDSIKVGVTTRTLEERYKWHLKKVFFSVRLSEVDAYILENRIHRHFRSSHDLRILKAGMRNGERWSGDTECYWIDKLDEIIQFIETYIQNLNDIDYKKEISFFEIPDFFPRDRSREKDTKNKPVAVVGVNPKTNEIVVEFDSISDATRAGYRNISQIVSATSDRQIAGGLRWFKKHLFNNNSILDLKSSRRGNPKRVVCIETGEEFEKISVAVEVLKSRGINVSGSHITSVCKGRRKICGGFRWKYVEEQPSQR